MSKQTRALLDEPLEEEARSSLTSLEAFELSHCPRHERLIDVTKHRLQRRGNEPAVVLYPAPKDWVEQRGDVIQRTLCLTTNAQFPDGGPHGSHRRGTDSGIEPAEQLTFGIPYQTGSKTVSEEFELDVRILARTRPVLAVDNPGLGRMQFQMALRQPCSKLRLDSACFLLAPAMHQSIIRIPTPEKVRVSPPHPNIKRIMQKKR
jgi:hypothetical protein